MGNWNEVHLKDLVDDLIMGQSPDSSTYNETSDGLPFVQGNADMDGGSPKIRIYTTDPKKLSEKSDILLSVRAPVGDLFKNNIGQIAIGRGISAIRIKSESIREFVFQYFSWNKKQFIKLQQGTTFTEIGKREVRNLKIEISDDKREIKTIAAILSKVDEAIEATQNSIKAAEKLKKALMQNLLTGKLKPDGTWRTEDEFYLDEKYGKVPIGWIVKPLKLISTIQRGKFSHRPRNEERFYNGDYPFVQTSDVVKSSFYLREHSQTLSELGIEVSKKFNVGSIVITIAANIGDVALTNYEVYFPDSLIGITPNNEFIDSEYLLICLMTKKRLLEQVATESAQKNINYGNLRPLPICYPIEIDDQQQIASKIKQTFEFIESKQTKIQNLQRLKKALMQNLLTGKVRLSEELIVKLTNSQG